MTSTTTPESGSVNGGSSVNTPLTSRSAATSTENLNAMEMLQLATDRSVVCTGANVCICADDAHLTGALLVS